MCVSNVSRDKTAKGEERFGFRIQLKHHDEEDEEEEGNNLAEGSDRVSPKRRGKKRV